MASAEPYLMMDEIYRPMECRDLRCKKAPTVTLVDGGEMVGHFCRKHGTAALKKLHDCGRGGQPSHTEGDAR